MNCSSVPLSILRALAGCPHHSSPTAFGPAENSPSDLICSACGRAFPLRGGKAFFSEPPADIDASEKVDPTDVSHWTAWRKNNFSYLEQRLSSEDPRKVLIDIGAGRASFRSITKGRFAAAIGVDFYPYECVDVIADLTQFLPLIDQSGDIAVATNVLEHLPKPRILLRECYRILKPGGYIIGTVPFLISVHQEPYDFLRYTRYMLELMLHQAGFSRVSVEPLGTPLEVYATMQRLFFDDALASVAHNHKAGLSFDKATIRVARKAENLLLSVLRRITPLSGRSSTAYTEGYGFMGWK